MGLTKASFARAVGVTKATVTGWEKGEFSPGRESLERIAKACGVSQQQLIFGHPPGGEGGDAG